MRTRWAPGAGKQFTAKSRASNESTASSIDTPSCEWSPDEPAGTGE